MTALRTFNGVALAALTTLSLAAPALAQDPRDWREGPPPRDYGAYGRDYRVYGLTGPGVHILEPELRDTPRGQAFVRRFFDFDHDGIVEQDEARDANRAYLDAGGPDRLPYGWWDHYAGFRRPPVDAYARGGWDRDAMRAYRFRQNRYGAMLTLQDVLFQTGSAALRPGAEAKLGPLAGYLRANPGVRLRIDGFTDSVGSNASNLVLSRDRARSVASALAATGVNADRFVLAGHGEASPVATNATVAGRQLNRRVEVTLLGQRAATFN